MYPYCKALDPDEALRALARDRLSLSAAEIADHCGYLKAGKVRARQVCKALACRDYVHSHYVRVANRLVRRGKDLLHAGRLSLGQARALTRFAAADQEKLLDKVARGRLSVRDLESLAQGEDRRLSAADEAYYRRLCEFISERCGHPVALVPDRDNARAGNLTLRYENLDMLDAICALLRADLSEFS